MSLQDFLDKKRREVQRDGPITAATRGVQEATSKGLATYAKRKATPVWDADWDVALVLDACRIDLWHEVASRYGLPNESRYSVGSASVEWINETFADQYENEWRNTGHVSANPHTGHPETFSEHTTSVYPLRDRGLPYLDEVWADQWHTREGLQTVVPEIVTDRAMWAWQRRQQYSFDKLLVHYMQPHIPFRSHPEWSPGWSNKLQFGKPLEQYGKKDDWGKLRDGELKREEVWRAYADNLDWVLGEVMRWVETTDAQILVTSDHGNAIGEWGMYGHPPRNGAAVLREVPWVTLHGYNGRSMEYDVQGNPPMVADLDKNDRQTRLEALGYA